MCAGRQGTPPLRRSIFQKLQFRFLLVHFGSFWFTSSLGRSFLQGMESRLQLVPDWAFGLWTWQPKSVSISVNPWLIIAPLMGGLRTSHLWCFKCNHPVFDGCESKSARKTQHDENERVSHPTFPKCNMASFLKWLHLVAFDTTSRAAPELFVALNIFRAGFCLSIVL